MFNCFSWHTEKYQLKATALFYSLLLSTLIGIMLTAFVAIWVFHKTEQAKDFHLWNQLALLDAGFKWVSNQNKDIQLENIQLFVDQKDSLIVLKQAWGFFELGGCKVSSNKQMSLQRIGLFGKKIEIKTAMVLAESRKPLALSGHSQIIGNAIVPLGGITTAIVNRKPFTSGKLVVGNITTGGGGTPAYQSSWFAKIQRPQNSIKKRLKNVPDSLHLSFMEAPYYFRDAVLELSYKNWEGPIFIEADSLIRIAKNCSLKGIILKAPIIEIEAGFKGQIQAIATLDMTIAEDVYLQYPSVLAIEAASTLSRTSARMRLGENAIIEGTILGFKTEQSDHSPSLSIDNAHITGRLLWEGSVEASGDLKGVFFAKNFFYRGDGTQFYFNYMVDFVIDSPARPKSWVEPIFLEGGDKKIAIWLN